MKAIKLTFIIAIVASLGALAAFSTRKADTNTSVFANGNASLNSGLNTTFEAKDKRFKEFLAQFPKEKMPFIITPNLMKTYRITNKSVSSDVILADTYMDFLPSLAEKNFGRMPVQGRGIAVAKIKEGRDFIAVLYANSTTYEYSNEDAHVTMTIATFDKEGKLINEENVANLGGGYNYMTATINKDLTISTRSYEYTYEKNVNEFGMENNKMTGSKLTKEAGLVLASNGTFTTSDDMRELKDDATATAAGATKKVSVKETAAESGK